MENKSDRKRDLRAWLYQLLAELEQAQGVDASKVTLSDHNVILTIKFID